MSQNKYNPYVTPESDKLEQPTADFKFNYPLDSPAPTLMGYGDGDNMTYDELAEILDRHRCPSRITWFMVGFVLAFICFTIFFISYENDKYEDNYLIDKQGASKWCLDYGKGYIN